MKLLKSVLLIFSLVLTVVSTSYSQQRSLTNEGTDFWLGFMPNALDSAKTINLFFNSTTSRAVVVIEYYTGGNGAVALRDTLLLSANAAMTKKLPVSLVETRRDETPDYRAVHVTATSPIVCYGYSENGPSSDGFLALPTHGLGKDYQAASYFDDWVTSPSQPLAGEFMIVAPYDSTDIVIFAQTDTRSDPTGLNISHKSNAIWSVRLMKGQTYLVQSSGIDKSNDISETRITTSKPIVLLSGHQLCAIPNDDPSLSDRSHLIEMIPPVDEWGSDGYVAPMRGRTTVGDYSRLTSGEDNLQIRIDTSTDVFLNTGAWYEQTRLTSASSYVSTKRFMTMMYSYSQGYSNDPGRGDPFMSYQPPSAQWMNRTHFRIPITDSGFNNYAVFTCLKDSLPNILLNGRPLSAYSSTFTIQYVNPTPIKASMNVPLPEGEVAYTASGNFPFSVSLYGSGKQNSYGMPGGMGVMLFDYDTIPPTIVESGNCLTKIVTVTKLYRGIATIELIKESDDQRGGLPATNMSLEVDSAFVTGVEHAQYRVSPIDPSQPGYAAIYIADRSGNHLLKEYRYQPVVGELTPSGNQFNVLIPPFADTCATLLWTNRTNHTVTIDTLLFLHSGDGYRLGASGGFPRSVDPGKTLDVQVCFGGQDTNTYPDFAFAEESCAGNAISLKAKVATSLILVHDLDFGTVKVGVTSCMGLKVENVGDWALTVNRQNLPSDPEVSIDPTVTFPIVLQPHTSTDIQYCFHPTKEERLDRRVAFATSNVPKYAHSIRDTATLIGRTANAAVAGDMHPTFKLLSLAPNPTRGSITLNYTLQERGRVQAIIYDERGAEVKKLFAGEWMEKGAHVTSLDLAGLTDGAYLLTLIGESSQISRKFVIDR